MRLSVQMRLCSLLFIPLNTACHETPLTELPHTDTPPTEAPPTDAPPTDAPPTDAPPTEPPPTETPQCSLEICDGKDNDCDVLVDEELKGPGLIEIPGDGIDQDCDGQDVCRDLNCDGYPDLVFSNYYDGSNFQVSSYIYWGSAEGYHADSRLELPTEGAHGNSIADLNVDGYLDIVFSNSLSGTSSDIDSWLYWGGPDGFSVARRTGLPTHNATGNSVADLNRDGWPDIFFSNLYASTSPIYWGAATGFDPSRRTDLPVVQPRGSTVSDVDQDGYLDIVVSSCGEFNGFQADSYVYWGAVEGFSAERRTALPTPCAAATAAADVDLDGRIDLLFANYYAPSFETDSYLYRGLGQREFEATPLRFPTLGGASVAVGDLNEDGWPDIVFANLQDGNGLDVDSYLYLGSSDGFHLENRIDIPSTGAFGLSLNDVTGDGHLDLILGSWTYAAQGHSYLFPGIGKEGLSLEPILLPTICVVGVSSSPEEQGL